LFRPLRHAAARLGLDRGAARAGHPARLRVSALVAGRAGCRLRAGLALRLVRQARDLLEQSVAMRAARLLSTLLLLQTRGRLTAQQIADELEVSVRTVYRDIEALGAAGAPVYAELGHGGGSRPG